jgi:hypothetical protein
MALAAVAVLATLFAIPSAQARGATAPGFFGLNFYFPGITAKDVLYLKASGARTVRWIMNWQHVQPKRRTWNWSGPDAVVGDLAAQGIRVLPVMWGSPGWVASRAVTPPITGPAQRNAWSAYLRAAVRRYGPDGNYWSGAYRRQHPGKTALPIHIWQAWNEPNLRGAMDPPSPDAYAQLLMLSNTAIKQADPHAKVMFGGLLNAPPNGLTAWDFLHQVLQQPGAGSAFDIMASHPYAHTVSDMLDALGRLRQTMAADGQGSKPLWITEIGWGSDPNAMGMDGQRDILTQAFNALLQKRYAWRLGRVLWFNFRDPAGSLKDVCDFCTSGGLLTNTFQAKPSWSAFRSFTGG